jgi:hypothetical protein
MLADKSQITFHFIPKDTIIRLPFETEFIIWKNSFMNTDSSIFHGEVHLTYNLKLSVPNSIALQWDSTVSEFQNIFATLLIHACDKEGNPLIINPDYSTIIRFHPKLNLTFGKYFQFDSAQHEFTTPINFYNSYYNSQTDSGRFTGVPNRVILLDYIVDQEFADTLIDDNHAYNNSLSRGELVGYELTLKNFGNYYISRKDEQKNVHSAKIKIKATVIDILSLNWDQVKIFLFTEQEDYNYYLRATHIADGVFEFKPAPGYFDLKLPLDYKYTLLCFAITEDKCFFYKKENIKLKQDNKLQAKLNMVTFDQLLGEIKSL